MSARDSPAPLFFLTAVCAAAAHNPTGSHPRRFSTHSLHPEADATAKSYSRDTGTLILPHSCLELKGARIFKGINASVSDEDVREVMEQSTHQTGADSLRTPLCYMGHYGASQTRKIRDRSLLKLQMQRIDGGGMSETVAGTCYELLWGEGEHEAHGSGAHKF